MERNRVMPASVPANKRFDQFEIAHRDRVEHQAVLPLVQADAVDVIERSALRGAHVVENRSCGGCGSGSARQAKSFER